MVAPIIQIMWLNRRPFLWVMCVAFLALATIIFMLPKRATVRSSVDIGSAVINEKQELFESPEYFARQIPSVYVPTALVAREKIGTPPPILSELQHPSVESIGRSVVLLSTVRAGAENDAKEFQKAIADQIIKQQAPREQVLRDRTAIRIASTTRSSEILKQEITATAKELEGINGLIADLRGQVESHRANLAILYQRLTTANTRERATAGDALIHELNQQIASQATLMGSLTQRYSDLTRDLATKQREYEAQTKAIADAQLEQKMFNQPYISLEPSLMPAAATTSRQFSFLLVALVISFLVAFGTVVLLHNVVERKPG
jgi:uncharacterized coiled-coil protein SlyX